MLGALTVMEKEDARTQSRGVLQERRKQVVRLHKRGVKPMQLVAQTELSLTAVNRALKLFAEGG